MMSFDPEKINFFAKTDARGQQVPFGIKARDRQRHMYVVGKTGMGKSTLLENMAVQDIQNGEGMAFIDPHGSAAETLLDYVPEHRINDVIYFAPFDQSNPVSFNIMEDVGADKRHLVVSGLMATFKKIWVDAWSARMEYILTNALLALIEYPDTTLLSVNRMFTDKTFRKQVVEYCQDPSVKAYWNDEFANYTERFAAEALPAIQNKVGQFTGNPLIRNIIGQPNSSFDIRKIMDEKKILIINLSKGLVGETNANLLGSMLTTRIYLAAMSRADLPVSQMKQAPNFYFYVDEFQSFANATFSNILSEARKYHLNLIIAHQYIEQMEEDVRNAVFGNVGTTIAFRVGPFDAEVLETVFSPRFLAPDLVNLGFAQVYLTLMIDGVGSQPFSAVTLPPITPPHMSCKDMVIAASRRNFAKPRAEVEKQVTELNQTTPKGGDKPKVTNANTSNNTNLNSEQATKRIQQTEKSASTETPKINKVPENNQAAKSPTPTTPKKSEPEPKSEPESESESEAEKPKSHSRQNQTATKPESEDIKTKTYSPQNQATKKPEPKRPEVTKNYPARQDKPNSQINTPKDLKAVLSEISGKDKNHQKENGKQNPAFNDRSPLRLALADILKKVETPKTEDGPKETEPVTEKTAVEKSTEPVNKDRDELERLTAEAESVFNHLEKSNTQTEDDPLAVKKIERLFKQSGNEKTPFSA